MAEYIDWTKPLKVENSIHDVDDIATEIDETEDGILAKAYALIDDSYRIIRNTVNNSLEFYSNNVLIGEFYADGTIKFNGEQYTGSEANHELLKTLVHLIATDNYTEIIRSSNFVTSIIIWTDVTKIKKIREFIFSRTNNLVSQVVTKQYDTDGNLKETKTSTINRTGNIVTSISEVMS